MQLGMIGLGRMGANMVRRLAEERAQVRRVRPQRRDSVKQLSVKARRARTPLDDFVKKLQKPRAIWLHGAAAV